jgi:hypothetical protein
MCGQPLLCLLSGSRTGPMIGVGSGGGATAHRTLKGWPAALRECEPTGLGSLRTLLPGTPSTHSCCAALPALCPHPPSSLPHSLLFTKVPHTAKYCKSCSLIVRSLLPNHFAPVRFGSPLEHTPLDWIVAPNASNCTHSFACPAALAISTPCRRVTRRDLPLLIC